MGWIDRIPHSPSSGALFIGGLQALYQPNLARAAGITHVLSVLDFDFHALQASSDFLAAQNYSHLVVQVEDDPNENLLRHFARMADFIEEGLEGGGGVFVHCAMGKSRSAAAVGAFLMRREGLGREEALARVCEGRPVCSPNPGFMEQLEVWGRMLRKKDEGPREAIYRDWLRDRFRGFAHEWEARAEKAKL